MLAKFRTPQVRGYTRYLCMLIRMNGKDFDLKNLSDRILGQQVRTSASIICVSLILVL